MQNVSAVRSARIGEEIETIKMAIGFQGIVNQNTDKTETQTGILQCGAIPLPHDGIAKLSGKKAGGKPEHRHHTPTRKRALVMREIPLYLLPAALQRGVREKGGKMYRVVIVRTHWHYYTIKIRCSTKKAVEQMDLVRHTDQSQHMGKVLQTNQSRQTDMVLQMDQSPQMDLVRHMDQSQHTDKVLQTDQSQHTDKVQQTNQSQQTDQTNTTRSSNRGGGT